MGYVSIKPTILLTQPLVQAVLFGMMALAVVLAILVSLGIKVNANRKQIILLTQPRVPQMAFGMTPPRDRRRCRRHRRAAAALVRRPAAARQPARVMM